MAVSPVGPRRSPILPRRSPMGARRVVGPPKEHGPLAPKVGQLGSRRYSRQRTSTVSPELLLSVRSELLAKGELSPQDKELCAWSKGEVFVPWEADLSPGSELSSSDLSFGL